MLAAPDLNRKPRLMRPIARWLADVVLRLLFRIILLIPPRALPAWGSGLGRLFYAVSHRYRRVALRNLRAVYPEMREKEIRRLARQVFVNFGKAVMEFLRIPFMDDEEIDRRVHIEGREHLDAALARGKGVIALSAHYGNWELLSCKMLREGYGVDAIVRKARYAPTTQFMTDIRQSKGMRIFPKSEIRAAVRALKENRILAILADQNDYHGILLDFLGLPALTSTGPATLALMTGAAIVPVFAVRQVDDTIRGIMLPPIIPQDSGDRARDIRELTELTTRIVEEQIREAPDQWMWFHGRWKAPLSPRPPAAM